MPHAKEDRNTTLRFAGLTRLEALQTAGPQVEQVSATEVRRHVMLTELAARQSRLEIPFVPPQHEAVGEQVGENLTEKTLLRFKQYYPQGTFRT